MANNTYKKHKINIRCDVSYKDNDSEKVLLDEVRFDYDPDLDMSCNEDRTKYISFHTLFIKSENAKELQAVKNIFCGDAPSESLSGGMYFMGEKTWIVNSHTIDNLGKDYKKNISCIQTDTLLDPTQTIAECINAYLSEYMNRRSIKRRRVQDILLALDLEAKSQEKVASLTDDEKLKLLLARELTKGYSDLVILDSFSSPTTLEQQIKLYGYLKDLDNYYGCVVVLSGSCELAEHTGGRVITIDKGKIIKDEMVAIYDNKAFRAQYMSVDEKNDYMLQHFRKIESLDEDDVCPLCGCSKLEGRTETSKVKFGGKESNTPWFTSVSTVLFCVCCGMRYDKKGSATKLEGFEEWLKKGIDGLDEKGKEEVRDLIKQIKARNAEFENNE